MQREAVVEVAGFGDDFGAAASDEQLARVGGHARCVRTNFRRVANGIHLHDVIDFVLGDAVRRGREGFNRFGEQHDFVGVLRVGHGVAERAADALSVLAVGVAEGVADRHAEEGDVNFQLAGFDEVDAAAVRVDLYRLFENAGGDGVGQFAAQAGGVEFADHAVFDVLNQRRVHAGERAGSDGEVLEAHARQHVHHHVDGVVAAAEAVVEGDGHAVLEAAGAYRVFDAGQHFARRAFAEDDFFLADFEGFEVIGCGESAFDPLFSVHVYSSRIPDAAARCSTSLARSMMGLSTILPLSETTPEPLRSASSAAAMTRSA